MSATLDGAAYARLMQDAPVIESEGRTFPLEYRYLGRDAGERIEDAMARAIRQALRENEGDVLAFLPGVAELERTAERVRDMPGIALHRLHGSLSPTAQRASVRSGSTLQLVLATDNSEARPLGKECVSKG